MRDKSLEERIDRLFRRPAACTAGREAGAKGRISRASRPARQPRLSRLAAGCRKRRPRPRRGGLARRLALAGGARWALDADLFGAGALCAGEAAALALDPVSDPSAAPAQ